MSTYAETPAKDKTSDEKLLEKAKRCMKQASDAEADQRKREQNALRYQVPNLQWDEDAKQARRGGTVGNQVTPPRPMLSISKLDQPIQLVLNQARAAKLGVNIHPVSEKADDDTAEVMQGIYRRIERDSNADQARLWALDRATKAGRGAYRVNTQWDDDSPETGDQEIVIQRILHQDMVYFDPSAQKPDFSDGEYAFVAAWVPLKTFRRLYPKSSLSAEDDRTFADLATNEPDWIKGDGDEKAVLVCEYFYKVHDTETIEYGEKKRERDKVTVRWCKLTATEVLEEQDWNGKYIPLIPVIGRELQPFGDERRWVGMVEPAMDGQKLYNFAASSLVERMALEPKAPWIMAEGQDEGHESEWDASNIRNFPRLTYKPVSLGATQAPPPQRAEVSMQGVALSLQVLQEADNFIQAATAIYDPSLGRQNPRDKSGKAILALQSQSDAGTSHYLASLADVSLAYEARVILDLIPAIYDRPGRIARILGGEDDSRTVMLNAPYVTGPDGRPMPAQEGQDGAQSYNLKDGTYAISTSIGKSFQTRLEQGQNEIGEILSANPALMPLIGATYFRFRDFPGAKEIADILKKVRDQQMPGLEDEKGGKPTPEQLQAQLQAMQAQGQQMQQQLQMAQQIIETDRVKAEAALAEAKLKADADMAKQRASDQTKLEIARLNAQVKGGTLAQEAQTGQVEKAEDHAFDFDQNAKDRELEVWKTKFGAAHDVGMAAGGANTVTRKREGGQEQENEEGQETSQGQSRQPKPEKPE